MLERKNVLVTGASSGIGRAIAVQCARAGADLAITYRSNQAGADATARAIRDLGRRAEIVRTDISREKDIDSLVAHLGRAFNRVDVWINNAGADILTGKGGQLSAVEKLDVVLAVDLRGTVMASWAAVGLMRKQGGGTIINMAWDHVTQGMEGENPGIYAAAKGGVASFSRSLARDVAPDIRVNILAPGFIETAFGEEANPKFRQKVIDMTPLGRWGKPDDVAGAAVFLASDDAAFLTGQTIMVNGGVVM
ncbi:MAG TPA: SDR family oxidoreductase [Gemmatimonadales bacterium]|nr:SDR family oxidoreductase [Gemmatimonadales bacterium]